MIDTATLDGYRQRLLDLAESHRDKLAGLRGDAAHGLGGESGGGISNVPLHPADLGSAYHEEEVELLLGENQEQLLRECAEAINRIDAGTFGLCENCFRQIPAGRLDTFPYARYCVKCASQIEPQPGA